MIEQFKIGGKTYSVKQVKSLNGENGLGQTESPLLKIKIAKEWQNKKVPEESKEQTLIHEVVHAVLDELQQYDLSQDECFVQSFSLLLNEFLTTRK